jgi:hypothetical protein
MKEELLTPEIKEKMLEIKALREEKENLNIRLDQINDKLYELNTAVTDFFESHHIQSMKMEGIGNFYLNRSLQPQIEDREALYNWLQGKGDYDSMLSFNSNKFRSYYKELMDNGEELPIGVTQFFKVEVRLRKN